MSRHDDLLRRYAEELAAAKDFAEAWWRDLTQPDRPPGDAGDEAAWRVRERWPDGPASHPAVLAVIRKYWLACDALNQQLERERAGLVRKPPPDVEHSIAVEDLDEEDEEEEEEDEDDVDPHLFVIESLVDGEHDELAEFLGKLTYWPIGLDDEDRFV
jgi:hypothetical protein